MKGTLKYLLLLIITGVCSFVIYGAVGPVEKHSINIFFYEK